MHGTNVKNKPSDLRKVFNITFFKIKIRQVGSKMFYADRQTDRYADRRTVGGGGWTLE